MVTYVYDTKDIQCLPLLCVSSKSLLLRSIKHLVLVQALLLPRQQDMLLYP